MCNAYGITAHIINTCILRNHGSSTLSYPNQYISMVGLTLTRPDIAFGVNKACQHMTSPFESHWPEIKRILGYLRHHYTQLTSHAIYIAIQVISKGL